MSLCRLCRHFAVHPIDGVETCIRCGCVEGPSYVAEPTANERCLLAERQEEDEENWYDSYPDSDDCFVDTVGEQKNDRLE